MKLKRLRPPTKIELLFEQVTGQAKLLMLLLLGTTGVMWTANRTGYLESVLVWVAAILALTLAVNATLIVGKERSISPTENGLELALLISVAFLLSGLIALSFTTAG